MSREAHERAQWWLKRCKDLAEKHGTNPYVEAEQIATDYLALDEEHEALKRTAGELAESARRIDKECEVKYFKAKPLTGKKPRLAHPLVMLRRRYKALLAKDKDESDG